MTQTGHLEQVFEESVLEAGVDDQVRVDPGLFPIGKFDPGLLASAGLLAGLAGGPRHGVVAQLEDPVIGVETDIAGSRRVGHGDQVLTSGEPNEHEPKEGRAKRESGELKRIEADLDQAEDEAAQAADHVVGRGERFGLCVDAGAGRGEDIHTKDLDAGC